MADYADHCGRFASRLVVLENLPHRKLFPIIAGARLVALPSLIDNLPNACLEAMGLGKVVIGTRGTSFDELIDDGVNGFLVAPNDASALTEKLISAWTDPQLVEMGAAAREAWSSSPQTKPLRRCCPIILKSYLNRNEVTRRVLNRFTTTWTSVRPARRKKVFGIGLPKTGTTSPGYCFRRLGYKHRSFDMDLAAQVKRNQLENVLARRRGTKLLRIGHGSQFTANSMRDFRIVNHSDSQKGH